MKKLLLFAALINLAVAAVHIVIGEMEIVAPLSASDAPELVQATLHAAWHMISVVLVLSSIALLRASRVDGGGRHAGALPTYIGIQYMALALVFVVASYMYSQFFIQILMLLPIGVLAFLAGRLANKA
jgi:hypothetical protein